MRKRQPIQPQKYSVWVLLQYCLESISGWELKKLANNDEFNITLKYRENVSKECISDPKLWIVQCKKHHYQKLKLKFTRHLGKTGNFPRKICYLTVFSFFRLGLGLWGCSITIQPFWGNNVFAFHLTWRYDSSEHITLCISPS